jgi:glycosyltransferase involved in cell wall biosynthesis
MSVVPEELAAAAHERSGARALRIVQTVTTINDASGGPAVSVTQLAAALAHLGHRCSIVALDYPGLGPVRSASPADVVLHRTPLLARRVADWSPGFRRLLSAEVDGADIVHNHGLWLLTNRDARIVARRARVPLVISPRGMLEPQARRRGRFKKWVAWRLSESTNMRAAAAFHATSVEEARSIRACGVRAPIAVIPNGVAESMLSPTGAAPARSLVAGVGDRRYVLFMSRLHPHKGLESLLDAWAAIQRESPDVRLIIAGPDVIGYQPFLERRARDLHVSDTVIFPGALDGERKSAALEHADAFVLSSLSESFGIVIAEALAHGLPVITTTGTPWQRLVTHECGWWVDPTVDALVGALREALALSPQQRRGYAQRGRALVREICSWSAIASDMATFYRWICDDRCKPPLAPTFLAE